LILCVLSATLTDSRQNPDNHQAESPDGGSTVLSAAAGVNL